MLSRSSVIPLIFVIFLSFFEKKKNLMLNIFLSVLLSLLIVVSISFHWLKYLWQQGWCKTWYSVDNFDNCRLSFSTIHFLGGKKCCQVEFTLAFVMLDPQHSSVLPQLRVLIFLQAAERWPRKQYQAEPRLPRWLKWHNVTMNPSLLKITWYCWVTQGLML